LRKLEALSRSPFIFGRIGGIFKTRMFETFEPVFEWP
jgi:hypothetical protein